MNPNTKPRIYLAAASADLYRAKDAREKLAEAKISLSYDWIAAVEENRALNIPDSDLSVYAAGKYAIADLDGIDAVDLVWVLLPAQGVESVGCWVELGYAISRGKDIVTSGNHRNSIFIRGLNVTHYTEDEDALQHVVTEMHA